MLRPQIQHNFWILIVFLAEVVISFPKYARTFSQLCCSFSLMIVVCWFFKTTSLLNGHNSTWQNDKTMISTEKNIECKESITIRCLSANVVSIIIVIIFVSELYSHLLTVFFIIFSAQNKSGKKNFLSMSVNYPNMLKM